MMPEGQGEQCGGPSTSCRRLRQRNLLQLNCWRKFADYIDFTLAFPRVTMWTNRIEPTLVKHSIRILEQERFAHDAHIVLCNLLTWLLHPLHCATGVFFLCGIEICHKKAIVSLILKTLFEKWVFQKT